MDALASGAPSRQAKTTVAEVDPYKGLEAFDEPDAPFFFGREALIEQLLRRVNEHRLLAVIGASGVGKSSAVRAGLIPLLREKGWDCVVMRPGDDPLRALIQSLCRAYGIESMPFHLEALLPALESADGKPRLLVIDQFEEVFARTPQDRRENFITAVARLADTVPINLEIIIVLRSDYLDRVAERPAFGALVNSNVIIVEPLSRDELRLVIELPARAAGLTLEPGLTDLIVNDAADAPGALPLLQYVLRRLWEQRRSGYLTVEAYREMGGTLSALAREAEAFLSSHPKSEAVLQRIFTVKLATIREDGEPMRRRASLAEFSSEEQALVSELVRYRLLITDTSETGEPYVEIAHDAILRSWDRLSAWLAGERDFLIWRGRLDTARRAWEAVPPDSRDDALLMGFALEQAKHYFGERGQDFAPEERQFIRSSIEAEARETAAAARQRQAIERRRRRLQALVGFLALIVLAGVLGWWNQDFLLQQWRFYTVVRPYIRQQIYPYVLTAAAEQALRPGQSFRECPKDCPEMIVVPAGSFMMGSPVTEQSRLDNEGPQHHVTIAKPFAISGTEVTFADWDACAAASECSPNINDGGFGRDARPVINVSWEDAARYVAWLSFATGKQYHLLSEAVYEYATRAGTVTAYPWGDVIGTGNANCAKCGSQWDNKETAPVGSFARNTFGLYDMVGNVWEWVDDCQHDSYDGAPNDGSAWISAGNWSRESRSGDRSAALSAPTRSPFSTRCSTIASRA